MENTYSAISSNSSSLISIKCQQLDFKLRPVSVRNNAGSLATRLTRTYMPTFKGVSKRAGDDDRYSSRRRSARIPGTLSLTDVMCADRAKGIEIVGLDGRCFPRSICQHFAGEISLFLRVLSSANLGPFSMLKLISF